MKISAISYRLAVTLEKFLLSLIIRIKFRTPNPTHTLLKGGFF